MRIALVAGEASGDMLAAHLIRAFKKAYPDARFVGIGGPKMEAEGFDAWWPSELLAVNGYVDVLRRFRELWNTRAELLKRLKSDPPDLFIGVDAPDFNLEVERRLRRSGIKTVHYVSPSIWAWRGKRVHKIKRAADMVLCLFPFEPAIYERHGVRAAFVGHPMADQIPLQPDREAARADLQLTGDGPVVALLPGSRVGEVTHLANVFVETAQRLCQRYPSIRFLVPLVTRRTRELFEEALYAANATELPLKIMFGHADLAMTAADAVLVASGTATLETALHKRPMVITYRMGKWSYRIISRMAYLPYVGLPNILAGEFVVPEYLQDNATAPALSDAIAKLLDDRTAREAQEARFMQMHLALRQDHATRAAEALTGLLGRH